MAGDTTKQMLSRISYIPDRVSGEQGTVLAGQEYDDVYIQGGEIANVDLDVDNLVLGAPLGVQYGGTGASTQSSARASLGLEIGADVQSWSMNLDDISAYTVIDDDSMSSASDTSISTSQSIQQYVLSTVASGSIADGDYGDITVSSSGSNWSIDNSSVTYGKIQNVSASDKILGRSSSGSGIVEEINCTAAGRALIDDTDAAEQRTTLGLGSLSTKSLINDNDWGGVDLSIDNGGTGASSPTGARTNLDVYSKAEVATEISGYSSATTGAESTQIVDGRIEKSGSVTGSSSSGTVTFDTAFPNNCRQVIITSASDNRIFFRTGKSVTNFTYIGRIVSTGGLSGGDFDWSAIGD